MSYKMVPLEGFFSLKKILLAKIIKYFLSIKINLIYNFKIILEIRKILISKLFFSLNIKNKFIQVQQKIKKKS